MGSDFSYNCYLLEFPNQPILLQEQLVYTLGRDEDNEIFIESSFVSRKHASISFANGAFYIKDLTSKNGTFLNSKAITAETILRDGDQIGVGDRIYVYYQRLKSLDVIDHNDQDLISISERIVVSRKGQMSGDFSGYSLADLLQYLSTRNRTGALLIRCTDDSDGLIEFREGHIEHSFYQGLKGEDALQKIIQAPSQQFQFEPKHKTDMISITRPTNTVLLDILKDSDL